MLSFVGRSAFRAAPRLRVAAVPKRFNTGSSLGSIEDKQASKQAVKAGAKRDPELYVCLGNGLRECGC